MAFTPGSRGGRGGMFFDEFNEEVEKKQKRDEIDLRYDCAEHKLQYRQLEVRGSPHQGC